MEPILDNIVMIYVAQTLKIRLKNISNIIIVIPSYLSTYYCVTNVLAIRCILKSILRVKHIKTVLRPYALATNFINKNKNSDKLLFINTGHLETEVSTFKITGNNCVSINDFRHNGYVSGAEFDKILKNDVLERINDIYPNICEPFTNEEILNSMNELKKTLSTNDMIELVIDVPFKEITCLYKREYFDKILEETNYEKDFVDCISDINVKDVEVLGKLSENPYIKNILKKTYNYENIYSDKLSYLNIETVNFTRIIKHNVFIKYGFTKKCVYVENDIVDNEDISVAEIEDNNFFIYVNDLTMMVKVKTDVTKLFVHLSYNMVDSIDIINIYDDEYNSYIFNVTVCNDIMTNKYTHSMYKNSVSYLDKEKRIYYILAYINIFYNEKIKDNSIIYNTQEMFDFFVFSKSYMENIDGVSDLVNNMLKYENYISCFEKSIEFIETMNFN